MDNARFDELVRDFTHAQGSRRLIAKGLFAAVVAGAPLAGGLDALANRRKDPKRGKRHKGHKGHNGHKKHKHQQPLSCSGDSCDGTGGKTCGGRDDCQCYRWTSGGNVCASSLQSSCDITCSSDHDCPHGHVCVEGGPACCGNGVKFCKAACYKDK
jgi:hypothetical protein